MRLLMYGEEEKERQATSHFRLTAKGFCNQSAVNPARCRLLRQSNVGLSRLAYGCGQPGPVGSSGGRGGGSV